MMPALFIGHGSPDNAFENNAYSKTWKKLSLAIPIPNSIICISAHWTNYENRDLRTSAVTDSSAPNTIYDFYGFPDNYYSFHYPAPGSTSLAQKIVESVHSTRIVKDSLRGLDHGAWSVLAQMYPKADIPVVQLSLDTNLTPEEHFRIGEDLAKLRYEGVLVLGSGNIVHNLMKLSFSETYPWADDFDNFIKDSLVKKDFISIKNYARHHAAKQSLPTDEHYLPLLYVAGASEKQAPQFFNKSIFAGSISMRCVLYHDQVISI